MTKEEIDEIWAFLEEDKKRTEEDKKRTEEELKRTEEELKRTMEEIKRKQQHERMRRQQQPPMGNTKAATMEYLPNKETSLFLFLMGEA